MAMLFPTLDGIGDVTITTVASGELLKWDGSAWVNNTLAEAGVAAASHVHAASDITSGTLPAARGGTDNTTPTAGSLLYGNSAVWTKLSAGTRGDVLLYGIGGSTAPSWGRHELILPMQLAPDANNIWADMPVPETFYQGTLNSITKINLALYTQVRLIMLKRGTAGYAGSILYAKYHTSFATAVGTYSALGTSAVSVPIDTGDACADSGWINLAAGAIADDVFVCLAGSGGDGIVDPHFGNIYLHFR